jgi:hypothetical protein
MDRRKATGIASLLRAGIGGRSFASVDQAMPINRVRSFGVFAVGALFADLAIALVQYGLSEAPMFVGFSTGRNGGRLIGFLIAVPRYYLATFTDDPSFLRQQRMEHVTRCPGHCCLPFKVWRQLFEKRSSTR